MVDEPTADLESHPIFGYLPDGRTISLPLHSLLFAADDGMGALWTGGTPTTVYPPRVPDGVVYTFDLFGDPYDIPGVIRTDVRMQDWGGVPDANRLHNIATTIHVARIGGNDVLVHCQAGVNRSSLACAYYMVSLLDWSPARAIEYIRTQRDPICFANENFEKFILGLRDDLPVADGR